MVASHGAERSLPFKLIGKRNLVLSVAFLFPGQGSQSVGMMDAFSDVRVVKDTFSEASDLLNQDMWKLASEGPEELLSQTVNTQPLMLVSDVAMFRAWMSLQGPTPDVFAGHSLGEYAALIAADAISFSETVPLVRARANLMQNAVPLGTGAMAAVLGLNDDDIAKACSAAMATGGVAEPANFNAPGQVVIAGDKVTVEKAVEEARGLGAKRAMLLAMSAPSHCSLIKEAAEEYRSLLDSITINPTTVPVIHNEDVSHASSPSHIKERLVRQLYRPVRWVECVQATIELGATRAIECGPGKVLSGLTKRIDKSVEMVSIATVDAMQAAIKLIREGKE